MSASTFINGLMVDFASMSMTFAGLPIGGNVSAVYNIDLRDVNALNYEEPVFSRVVRGTGARPLARYGRWTEAKGDIEFGLETFRLISSAFGDLGVGGFSDVIFDFSVSYQTTDGDLYNDVLHGCRFLGLGQLNRNGGSRTRTSSKLSIDYIEWDGAQAVGPLPGA